MHGGGEHQLERTFAVNHLAHHHLLNLLWHHFAADATLVATTSGTHDPAETAGTPPPHHADALRLAYPDRDPDRDRNPSGASRQTPPFAAAWATWPSGAQMPLGR